MDGKITQQEDVFSFIKNEETEFQSGMGVPVIDGWDFKMYEHIRKSTLYKYGQLANRVKTDNDPVINIILPILNVAYRLLDVDVKDIVPYVDMENSRHLSLLVKRFHDRWARREEFDLDDYLDELKEQWYDFGLGLTKKGSGHPEVVPLQRLAFCDQTDIMAGPICEKHTYSIDQLMDMKGKWDSDSIDEIIVMAQAEKSQQQVQGQKQQTPGKYIEVYELHGIFPETYNPDIEDPDPNNYERHAYYVSFYHTQDNYDKGIILYHGPESKNVYESLKRDRAYGRACGYGGVEELFEPQVWHTYSEIQKKEMLDAASSMIIKAIGFNPTSQKITDMEKGEFIRLEEDQQLEQLVFQPINWAVFDDWQEKMKLTAQTQGSANDPQLGVEPKSGTPYALQRLTTVQGQGIHQYRQGQFTGFIGRLYRKWFLKQMVQEMNKGDKWVDEVDLKDLQYIAEKVSANAAMKKKKNMLLRGKSVNEAEMAIYRENLKEQILGNNQISLKVIKDEFKDIPIKVKVNVSNKQKNLIEEADKIIALVREIVSNPMLLQDKGWSDLINQVIENYGLNPVSFQGTGQAVQQMPPQAAPQAAPQVAPQAPIK